MYKKEIKEYERIRQEYQQKIADRMGENLKEKRILKMLLGAILFLSSCSFPHWTVPQRHVTVDATVGNAPEVVQVDEMRIKKSHFNIEQFFRSKTLNISEKSFSVLYQGKQIQPKVWAVVSNKYRRLKDLTTIPPMTSINIHFKIKRNLGDTIVVVEHDIPQINDSVVIKVEIPEEDEKEDSIDRYNWYQLHQLSGMSVYSQNLANKNNLYYDLKFEDGICVREYKINSATVSENILHGNMTENMNLIMTENEVPQKALTFLYQYIFYNISISNDCDLSCLNDKDRTASDNYKIRVKFFENVKQPYQYKYPFAIIESISNE